MSQLAIQDTYQTSFLATELLFVNADVPESEILLAGLASWVEVVRLPGDCNGIARISEVLADRTGVTALHILGHGGEGRIELGCSTLSLSSINAVSADLSTWGRSLAEGADILFYGCDVGSSADGAALIARLAYLTGADVAASTDLTGAAALGGSWILGLQTGQIEAVLPFSTAATAAWQHTLNHFRYGTMSWEPVAGSPNSVVIKGQVDWTNDHGHIPDNTPVGGVVASRLTLNFGDGTSQSVAVRVLSRDAVTNDVLTEFVSDLDGDGIIGASEVGVRHNYAATGNYEVFWGSSAREFAIGQDSSTWQQDLKIDLSQAGNQSPVVATPAVVQVVDNTIFTYQIAASDPDGNPLRFRYGTQDEFYNNGVATEATRPTGLILTADGLITWDVRDTGLSTAEGDRWQVTIMAEDLDANGNVKSTVPVDFVLQIVQAGSQPPTFTQLPSGPQLATSGQTSTFTVEMDDPDSTAAPTITVLNPPSTNPTVFQTVSSVSPDGKTTLTISFTPTQDLEGNSYIVNVRGRDGTGLTTDQSITLTVPDTTPPAVPSALVLTAGSDTGVSTSDAITNVSAPTVTGTTDAGSTVTVLVDSVAVGTTTANGAGIWSYTLGTPLLNGVFAVTAIAADTAGNPSAASAVLALTVDTQAPITPTGLTLALASDSGTVGDAVTSVTTPVITGNAEAGSTVTLIDGASVLGTAQADSAGLWSFTPVTALAEGPHSIVAIASDLAGNVSATSTPLPLTIDNVVPVPPANLALASTSDSGILGDGVTNDSTPTLTGTAEAGSTVTFTDTSTGLPIVLGTTLANNVGQWSFTSVTALTDGVRSVTATQTDAAGNVSVTSAPLSLIIDSSVPAPPANLTLAPPSDSGSLGDGITNDNTPTLTGTAEAGRTVTLTDTSTGLPIVLGTTLANNAGQWSFTPGTALTNGVRSVTATQADAAGNVSPASAVLPLTIDTTVPPAPSGLTLAPTSDSGTMGDGITNDSTPTLTGTAEAGSTVTVTDTSTGLPIVLGTTLANNAGQWSLTLEIALTDGVRSVTATQTDAAGNVSPASTTLALTIDTTIPPVPSGLTLAPASDSGTPDDRRTNVSRPVVTGRGVAGDTVTLFDGLTPVGVATVADNGTWLVAPSANLSDGNHTLTTTQTNSVGNVSPASATLVLTIDTAVPTLTTGSQIPNDATPTISGRATPGSTVALLANGVAIGSAIADATTGTFEVPANTSLALGLNSLTTTQTTPSGTSAASAPLIVFVVEAPEQGISTTDFSSADIGGALDLGARLAFIGGTEAVLLTDSTLSVGINTNQATLQRLYQGLLGRGNDTVGITYWDDQLNDGVSKAVVAAGFLTTDEYVATHSVQTDEQFVTSLYRGMLGRAPEQEGLAAWTGALAQGSSRGDIIISIADSNEAKSHLALTTAQVYVPNDAGTLTHVLYETGLGREVELPALAYWKVAYDVLTPLQLTALIASTPEFTAYHAGQDNDVYVNSLYQAGLGRPAEASGMASWSSLLNSGEATRTDVLLAIATSGEAKAHLTYNLSG